MKMCNVSSAPIKMAQQKPGWWVSSGIHLRDLEENISNRHLLGSVLVPMGFQIDCILIESNIKLYKRCMPDYGMLSPRKKSLRRATAIIQH